MPYASVAVLRAYQLRWMKQRREAWIAERGPCAVCGSIDNLQVDHLDPHVKVNHRIWSWGQARRLAELAKCQVLCRECHQAKTNEQSYPGRAHGTVTMYRHGCRCAECRESKRIEKQRQRRR